jgi:HPt (histidine-containing phosphotransfer) domain-containing protein
MSIRYTLIDPAVLMNAAGDDADGFRELLAMFLRIVPEMTRALEQAVHARRHDDIAHHAHSLKSCLSLVGAAGCSARLDQLERAARRQDPDCGAGFDQLHQALAAVIDEALRCQATGADGACTDQPSPSPHIHLE